MKKLYFILVCFAVVSCQNKDKSEIEKAKQVVIDSMKIEIEKQHIVDSMQVEMAKLEQAKIIETQKVVVVNKQATTATATKKKRWSGVAKGAVIGAGVGAVTGAIISKKKGEGAIIGGVAGAAIGAGTGAILDGSKKE